MEMISFLLGEGSGTFGHALGALALVVIAVFGYFGKRVVSQAKESEEKAKTDLELFREKMNDDRSEKERIKAAAADVYAQQKSIAERAKKEQDHVEQLLYKARVEIADLRVEMATLKAENAELKRRLGESHGL